MQDVFLAHCIVYVFVCTVICIGTWEQWSESTLAQMIVFPWYILVCTYSSDEIWIYSTKSGGIYKCHDCICNTVFDFGNFFLIVQNV